MLLDKPESHLGQILQELLLMEPTEREKRQRSKKGRRKKMDTGKFPCICYSVFPNLSGHTMLPKGFGMCLPEITLFGRFQREVGVSSANVFTE